jgi:hypothetical protein
MRPIHECTYTAKPRFVMQRPRRALDSPLQPPRKLEGPRRIDRARRTAAALYPSTLPESEPARVGLQTARAMLNAGWFVPSSDHHAIQVGAAWL